MFLVCVTFDCKEALKIQKENELVKIDCRTCVCSLAKSLNIIVVKGNATVTKGSEACI